jgi:hypothetical protein
MNDTNLFLLSFSILFAIGSIIAYNIDFSKWEDKYSHE